MADSYFVSVLGLTPGLTGPTLALALIEADALILRIAGKPDLRLPYSGLSVAVDPNDPERVLLRGAGLGEACVAVEDRRVGEQIARRAPPAFAAQWRALQTTGRTSRSRTALRKAAVLTLAAGVAAITAWWSYGALVSFAVAKIPPRYEAKLGDLVAGSDRGVVKDKAVVAAVQKVSARLLATLPDSPYQFRVVVVANPHVNAYALPGGRIVVYSGLMASTQSPDELAGVLAHEIQHILRRHSLRAMVRRLGVQCLFAVVFSGRGAAADILERYAPNLIGLRFDRFQEAEADAGGMGMLLAAGIPGDGMVRFFKTMSGKESGAERALNFASDHPTSQGRFEELARLMSLRPAPPPVDWGLDWAGIRTSCRKMRTVIRLEAPSR